MVSCSTKPLPCRPRVSRGGSANVLQDGKIAAVLAWGKTRGVEVHPAVTVQHSRALGVHLVSRGAIKTDDRVMHVPLGTPSSSHCTSAAS